ncbi:MAG: 4-(cytidine 5'-diphospho)-2-C-methyl-D-erythritol kinase [Clostridia bacterium]|nr:4-(cytidine 5'-diphospho)-2-C-methyl-D-erythritol kinase [Clostridia bacterium]
MNSLELKARAKINLSLDVLRKRPDGYHDLRMIMQTIELHDKVGLEVIEAGIEIRCDHPSIPLGNSNIAYKAAELLINEYKISKGVRIRIEKNIPVAAGLAGGSTDAAAVLKGMNRIFSLGLSRTELMALGKKIGADVPYCIRGGTMLAEGIGEVLTELPAFRGVSIVLIKPRIDVSTAWVYKSLNFDNIDTRPNTSLLMDAIRENKPDILAQNMANVLETVTIKEYGIINIIKEKLMDLGAMGSMMSGSGPTVFGIFRDEQAAQKAFSALDKKDWDCFITKTICEE